MNSPLPLRLGVALLLATTSLPLPAADVPKLISQPTARTLTTSPKETAEQKAARHVLEMQAAEAKITALKQTLPLLTGPNADAQLAVFQAELLKLKDHPDFKPPRPAAPKAFRPPPSSMRPAGRRIWP
jgi:hypothetical protein